ncbi:YrhB domain-containing protein [Asaia lannensis]
MTFEDARASVELYLSRADQPLQIVFEQEFESGWCFRYQSKRFLETHDPGDRLAGSVPLIVDRKTGKIRACPTDRPLEECLADYVRTGSFLRK